MICLGRQLLLPSSPDSAVGAVSHIKVGSYYEIDRSKLPSKTPDQLKLVRVVMVSKKSKCSVSLRYPSMYSLRAHFSQLNRRKVGSKMLLPALDEQYAMVSEFAGDVLYRRIPPHELAVQRNQWSFWVMEVFPGEQEIGMNRSSSSSSAIVTSYVNMVLKKGLCWSELISGGMVRWGRRRQVRFFSPHEEPRIVQGEEEEKGNEEEKEIMGSKRKLHGASLRIRTQTAKKLKQENDQQITLYKPSKRREVKNSIERWSVHRYNLAEKNMLKIMKEKGAMFGNPILRPALRAEARKLIGDTGLLDHLLKHMAWKVAPGGEERFMRRHNADGAMEYWLESADLMDIRKEAGVQDPYWNPPPGWKLGDNPTQDPVCARELKELREEIAKLKMGMMENKKTEENLALVTTPNSAAASQNMVHEANMLLPLKEKYMGLMKLKDKLEGQLGEIGKSLSGVEEEMGKLKSKVEAANALLLMGLTTQPSSTESDKTVLVNVISDEEKDGEPEEKSPAVTRKRRSPVVTREEKASERLKSGFRICKPQGTFLWPNMSLSRQVAAPNEDLVSIPTPPSVSSSIVKRLPERRNTSVAAVKYLPTATPHYANSLINLNEVPGNGNLQDHHGSPCPLTYQRRHHLTPSTSMPRMMHGKKEKEMSQWEAGSRQQQQRGNSSPSSPRTWLALSTPTSSFNIKRV
ncbi:hypothetical protein HRI_001332400 [Hibiscus trionum]|uniref:PTC1-like winged helix-turn-helix domain-containing protein n=1 Tax=Hibiscus trionum TaxID=183268 RepID=A0A9W7HG41_HIBTR|nr:hypothetical protein HRI_001332400 [Hibiscus trionum]